ncbi:MAG: helix-turn-helix domain-containing protein [Candidatus Diapherotrites archaeon]
MEELKLLGLAGYEGAVFQVLLSHGKLGAKEVAHYSKVPLTAVYPNLKSLVQKGLIQEIGGKKAEFEAFPPSEALKALADKKAKELEEARERAVQKLEGVRPKSLLALNEIVSVFASEQTSKIVREKLIKAAKKSIYVVGWRLRRQDSINTALLKELEAARKKGIDVRVILTARESVQMPHIQHFLRQGMQFRFLPLQNFSIMLRDGEECKISLKRKDLEEHLNIHINDADLSKFLNEYFLSVWKKGEEIPIQQ